MSEYSSTWQRHKTKKCVEGCVYCEDEKEPKLTEKLYPVPRGEGYQLERVSNGVRLSKKTNGSY